MSKTYYIAAYAIAGLWVYFPHAGMDPDGMGGREGIFGAEASLLQREKSS